MMPRIKMSALAVTLSGLVGAAHASQSYDLTQGVDFSTWTLLVDAAVMANTPSGGYYDNYLRLTTQGSGNQAGAAFAPAPLLLDFNQAFDFTFRFFVAHGSVAQGDGMTFVLNSVGPEMGGYGSDLGYGNSANDGYALAIDTFNFPNEPEAVSIQILENGSVAPIAHTETGLPDIQPAEYYQWTATLRFAPSGDDDETGTLTGEIYQAYTGDTFSVFSPVDWSTVGEALYDIDTGDYLGREIYYGFTAANGLADDGHFVGSLVPAPIPEPETYAMLLAGLGLVGLAARRRGRLVSA
ncbi:MAG TPA: PEP-CTERM sorting domain-containing protein [Thiobacillaceae bacterium]|nr:PEP-CTERM sorting domain-containing protein [Thiobacillaceae bacterium]